MAASFKRSFALNIGIILLAFGVFAFLFYFIGGKLAAQATLIVNDRSLISRSTGAAERLAGLKKDQQAAEGYQRIMDLLLPPQEKLLDLPRDVESVGRLHQVGALLTFTGADESGANTSPLGFTITATGSGQHLIDFLKELEVNHSKYTIAIDSIDITGGDPQTQQLLATGRVFSNH